MIRRRYFLIIGLVMLQSAFGQRGRHRVSPALPVTDVASWASPSMNHDSQMAQAVNLMQQTLFQNVGRLKYMHLSPLKRKKYQQETHRQEIILRRLVLLLAAGNMQYRGYGASGYVPWPFPLATALTQGQRVMFHLQGITADEFLNFITSSHPHSFYKRNYSSHGIVLTPSGYMTEVKIKSPFRKVKSTEKILGMNFPLGGVGSRLPKGGLVGPMGREYSLQKRHLHKRRQIGHLHIYTQDFPEKGMSGVLVGIEGCAPGTSNQFGCNHNLLSGLKNQKLKRSSSGGLKWSKLQTIHASPQEYNGKIIYLTRDKMARISAIIDNVLSQDSLSQQTIFLKILQFDGPQAMTFLSSLH